MFPSTQDRPLTTPMQHKPARHDDTSPLSPRPQNAQNRTGARRKQKPNQKPILDWLNQTADTIYNVAQVSEEERVRQWVTLIRRHRGSSLSDYIGVFGQRGTWLDAKSSNIKVLNIVEPAVRANTATISQTNISLDFEAATSKFKGAASVSEAIIEYLKDRDLTENLKYRIADMTQLSSCAFLRSDYDLDENNLCGSMKVPDILDSQIVGQGEYACGSCGESGNFDADDLEQLATDTPPSTAGVTPIPENLKPQFFCPGCGGRTEIVSMPESSQVPALQGFSEMPAGDNRTKLHSAFEIRMAPAGTNGGNLAAGDYFEHHHLMRREEIEEIAPHLKLGVPSKPSYALLWQHALENGLKNPLLWADDGKGAMPDDLFEVRKIYLKPARYRSYVAPADYNLTDAETNENVWSIKQNETLSEAIQRNPAASRSKEPLKGVCYWLVDKQLMVPPHFADFTKEWSIIQFAPDAFSAWARPFNIILPIQEHVNNMATIKITHLDKNSHVTLVYDSEMFEDTDLEEDFAPTKAGARLERPIGDYIQTLQAPNLGNEIDNFMQFMLAMETKLSGVQPAALGAAQPGTPYQAQLLQVNQSQGMLTPVFKSLAQAWVTWAQQQLELAQTNWPEEMFSYVQSRYGDEWKQSDIENFTTCEIGRDVIITYIQGTEIPKTLQQKELKLQQFFTQILQISQAAPGSVSQQQISEIISQMADYADLDFDSGNYEGDHRLAMSRLERLREAVAHFNGQAQPVPIDPNTGQAAIDPATGQSVLLVAAQHIITQAKCLPVPEAENHNTHKEFWADHIRALLAEPDGGDEMMIAVMVTMLQLHDKGGVQAAQIGAQNQVDSQLPIEQHQQELQQQQIQAQAQAAATEKQQELQSAMQQKQGEIAAASQEEDGNNAESAQQAAESGATRDHETAHKIIDVANEQENRDHEIAMKKMEIEAAKTKQT